MHNIYNNYVCVYGCVCIIIYRCVLCVASYTTNQEFIITWLRYIKNSCAKLNLPYGIYDSKITCIRPPMKWNTATYSNFCMKEVAIYVVSDINKMWR